MTGSNTFGAPDTSPRFFEQLYRGKEDPWNFRRSPYERQRYQAILDVLDDRSYARAFEPGCSIGELTAGLAPCCERIDGIDLSPSAVNRARDRCGALPQVSVYQGALPDDIPDGTFDLIVFSEIGYYFSLPELTSIIERLWCSLRPGGRFVACHWLGHSADHVLHGLEVAGTLEAVLGRDELRHPIGGAYHLQRWSRD